MMKKCSRNSDISTSKSGDCITAGAPASQVVSNRFLGELHITGEKWFASGESKILSRGEAIFQKFFI
jgi:hypothetical protein